MLAMVDSIFKEIAQWHLSSPSLVSEWQVHHSHSLDPYYLQSFAIALLQQFLILSLTIQNPLSSKRDPV